MATPARLLAPIALGLLGACSLLSPGPQPQLPLPADLPAHVDLVAVPFHPQEDYQCGPAALATLLGAAGVTRTPAQLAEQVYVPQRHGALQPEMLAAARRAGLVAYPLPAEPAALLRELAAGHPVLVLQNLRWDIYPLWHYAVLVGFDLPRDERYLRSGTQPHLVQSGDAFDRTWTRAGRWAFVALPPEQLPASASEDAYVAAVAALERLAPAAAQRAYRTALVRWPGNLVAQIGLGNIAYGQRRLEDAQLAYREAAERHPDSADAWNNLAQALHDLGRDAAAEAAARRAVALGGPRLGAYQETLRAIRPSE